MSDRIRKFVATVNVPSYLPMEDDPPVFDTPWEAWRYLKDERERGEDDAETEGNEYSETRDQLAVLGRQHRWPSDRETRKAWLVGRDLHPDGTGTVYGPTPGYDGDHDLGLAYSVSLRYVAPWTPDDPSDRYVELSDEQGASVLKMIDDLYAMIRTLNGLPGSYQYGSRPVSDSYEHPFYWVQRSILSLLTTLLDSQDAAEDVWRIMMDDRSARWAIVHRRNEIAANAELEAEAAAEDARWAAENPSS